MNLADDGVTHINVYSKGTTALGRALSNFAHIPFMVVPNGRFESIEAYWYWLRVMETISLAGNTTEKHSHLISNLYSFCEL